MSYIQVNNRENFLFIKKKRALNDIISGNSFCV